MRILVAFALIAIIPLPRLLAQVHVIGKTAVPDLAAQAAATKVVKEVFGAEWAAAKTPAQQLSLSKTLLQKGRESSADKAAEFVLFKISSEIAIQAGDMAAAFAAISAMEQQFEIDAFQMQADALTRIAPLASKHTPLSQKAIELSDVAAVKGKYPIAISLAELAISEANKSKDPALIKQAIQRKLEIEANERLFAEAATALDVLGKNPDDPEANLAVGKYTCFVENDWDTGLRSLVKGGNAELKSLAEIEMKKTLSAAEQLKLADDWWKLEQPAAKKRAAYWYKKSLPGLSGLSKDRVEKRVAEFSEFDPCAQFNFSQAELMDGFLRIPKIPNWTFASTVKSIKTKQPVAGGADITIVARTEKNNIRIFGPGRSYVIFNWEVNPKTLRIQRPDDSPIESPTQKLSPNKWHTLHWIVTEKGMTVSVDGAVVFSEDRKYQLSSKSNILVQACDSDVDVKSFVVKSAP